MVASSVFFCYSMIMLPLTIRKRTITDDDLTFIQSIIYKHWNKGRTQISKILCKEWNWVQPNGQLKDMACREVLITLYRKGLIDYPDGLHDGMNKLRNKSIPLIDVDQSPVDAKLSDVEPVTLKLARNTELEPLYNSLIQEHHYLGFCQIVGNHLKYIAFIGDRPVACLGWGSAAWSVKSRDAFIFWNKQSKQDNLHFISNNTRFLILPWIHIKCLASRLLSLNAKRISEDWLNVYNSSLCLLETFVEKNRFKGTCYRAANWICTGQTKGTSKKGNDHMYHGNIKDVYLYPLRKDFKKILTC